MLTSVTPPVNSSSADQRAVHKLIKDPVPSLLLPTHHHWLLHLQGAWGFLVQEEVNSHEISPGFMYW